MVKTTMMSTAFSNKVPLDVTVSAQPQCCAHGTECAVHQMPYDAEFAVCTSSVGVGSVRHEAILKETSSASIDDRERAADSIPRLGELLIAQGKLTLDQLAIALDRQKTSGRRLGEELIKAGYVQRAVVSRAMRIQRRLSFSRQHGKR